MYNVNIPSSYDQILPFRTAPQSLHVYTRTNEDFYVKGTEIGWD